MRTIYEFQELARIIDATLESVNPEGLINGQNTKLIIEFLLNFPGMNKVLCEDEINFIKDELIKTESKNHIREEVKKILMYPELKYDEWKECELSPYIKEKSEDVKFKITLVDGKVYAKCLNDPSLTDIVFSSFHSISYVNGCFKNEEPCHITLVNSNIVALIGIDEIAQFISSYSDEFIVRTGAIKSTVSRDWSKFSKCYVIDVFSEYCDDFISAFNEKYKDKLNKPICMSKHITFATKSRNLFI